MVHRQMNRRQMLLAGMAGFGSLAAFRDLVAGPASGAPAAAAGTLTIGGDLTVNRMGFGAMRLTGEGIWGEPKDPAEARRVLRRAVELGVNFIDTADAYGPEVNERIIAETLHPYPRGLVIATKGGITRPSKAQWESDGRPEHLRAACEASLKRLKLDRIDLLLLDDFSYVRRDQTETTVLFELISERYERKSIALTANQPFSEWHQVFPEPAMTVAAIDRLVHHATILELNAESYRRKTAERTKEATSRRKSTTTTNDN